MRLHPELVGKHAHAGFVLMQGGATRPALCQQPDQLAVHVFVPRLQFEQPLRPVGSLGIVALFNAAAHETRKRLRCQVVATLTLQHEPGLELRAAVQAESLQKLAAW